MFPIVFVDLFLYCSSCISGLCDGRSIQSRLRGFSGRRPAMSRLTILAPTCFCLLLSLLTPTAFATPDPVPAPVNGDPCGPAIQDTPNYPNTCASAPLLYQSPQQYGINCTADLYGSNSKYAIAYENCSASLQSICGKAIDTRARKGYWIWSYVQGNCALGIYQPALQGSAQLRNYTRCLEIFTAISDSCSSVVPASTIGGVNLRHFPGNPPPSPQLEADPGSWVHYTGEAVNAGYPSYIISKRPIP